jgi:hypothetical protein
MKSEKIRKGRRKMWYLVNIYDKYDVSWIKKWITKNYFQKKGNMRCKEGR